jgi:hypothetical protein
VDVIVVVGDALDALGRPGEADVEANERVLDLGARDEGVDQALGQAAVDLGGPGGLAPAPVTARIVQIDVQPRGRLRSPTSTRGASGLASR